LARTSSRVRNWARQANVDDGEMPGVTSEDKARTPHNLRHAAASFAIGAISLVRNRGLATA